MSDRITIKLTGRRPVSVLDELWPVIASAHWYDSHIESQANREAHITVREHKDGRRIVSGWSSSRWEGERGKEAGHLVDAFVDAFAPELAPAPDYEATVTQIEDVADRIGYASSDLAHDCIADLPAEILE